MLGGDHVLAAQLISEYTDALRELWESLPEPDRTDSPLPKQSQELLAWAREMAVVQRAMAAEQLAIIRKAGGYQPLRDPESSLARTF